MLRLSQVSNGKYKIIKIEAEFPGIKRRLTTLGVFVGDEIEVTKSAPGPVIFKKHEASIGIGHGIAMRIYVVPAGKSGEI